ncbi:MAG: dockerin type I repeat-containing protein, partial [Clostridia bacterium]|nr:dockerin type I repeat-containing protein [Clostridia bacterium]
TVFPADAATVSGNTVTVTKAGDIMVTVAYGAVFESVVLTAKAPEVTGLRGDVNCDGSVRMNDLVALLSHLSSGTELSAQGMVNADVNGDGAVRMNDLVGLLSFLSTGSWPF